MSPVLLFGGRSAEHEVSVLSAASVAASLLARGISPYLLGIGKDGKLYRFHGTPEELIPEKWQDKTSPLSLRYEGGKPLVVEEKNGHVFTPDVIFPLLHGTYGEDGHWQGLLSLCGVPYLGAGLLSSALCMHKAKAKALAAHHGIATPIFFVAENAATETLAEIERTLSYPLFVKPLSAGSSFGVSRVENAAALRPAIKAALAYGDRAIVEEEVAGTELSVGVLEKNGQLLLSPVGEIRVEKGFYDYEAKYKSPTSHLVLPALLSSAEEKSVKDKAAFLFRLFECRDFARVDFLRSKKGTVFFGEINTIPGFTKESLFPKLFASIGIDPLSFLLEDRP